MSTRLRARVAVVLARWLWQRPAPRLQAPRPLDPLIPRLLAKGRLIGLMTC